MAAEGGDCADGDKNVFPGAKEACNGKDDDCNGEIDEGKGATFCKTYYRDADADGYGLASDKKCLCGPDGDFAALLSGDCDDGSAATFPGAPELCANLKDDDCDGQTDEENSGACSTYFFDGDGDGYGVEGNSK